MVEVTLREKGEAMTGALERTGQLREYRLRPNSVERFFAFWNDRVVPLREEFGFRVEWHVIDEQESRFTWFVSAPGSAEDFRTREADYNASPRRAEVFSQLDDDPVESARTRLVVTRRREDGR